MHLRRRSALVAEAMVAVLAAGALVIFGAGTAAADPSANAWYQLRQCESSNRYDIDTGNGYYGAYQFNKGTWRSMGGSGLPSEAPPAEQDYRALKLYRIRGWGPWPGCSDKLGLQGDSDAASKVAPPTPKTFDVPYAPVQGADGSVTNPNGPGDTNPSGSGDTDATDTASDAPTWPGQQYFRGDSSPNLVMWQRQAATLGYPLTGTGYFGPHTESAVLDIQRRAGLNVVGFIGPKTWRAAWTLAANDGTAADSASTAVSLPFADVTKNTHLADIAWLADQDITQPRNGLFHPTDAVTRGAMTAFLFRLTHQGQRAPRCTAKPFPDVSSDDVFCGDIQWAANHHVTKGLPNGNFGQHAPVTRGAMAAFLRAVATGQATPECDATRFADVDAGDQFCDAVTWLGNSGITRGMADGTTYGTTQVVTRQQMASFLHRTATYMKLPNA